MEQPTMSFRPDADVGRPFHTPRFAHLCAPELIYDDKTDGAADRLQVES